MSDEPFQLSHFSFEKLASLLKLLKDLDLASLNQPWIPVVALKVSPRTKPFVDAELPSRFRSSKVERCSRPVRVRRGSQRLLLAHPEGTFRR